MNFDKVILFFALIALTTGTIGYLLGQRQTVPYELATPGRFNRRI